MTQRSPILPFFLVALLGACSAGTQPPPAGGDADADADTDVDADSDSDTGEKIDPDCVLDPSAEGCPCDALEPEICFTGAPAIVGEGHCTSGLHHCEAGVWGACEGERLPQPERCNVFDDDCDGEVDDDVDCGDDVVETHPCGGDLVIDAFSLPELETHWGTEAPDVFPGYVHSVATPVVGDFVEDLDESIPEIVLITYEVHLQAGVVRVFSGRDPHDLLWTDAGWGNPDEGADVPRIDHDSHPALGDLTGDGRPELVVGKHGGGLIAYESDGDLLWESALPSAVELGDNGSVAIAHLDNDGSPEVIVGRTVLDSNGELLWVGNGGRGENNQGPLSCVADLDGDGELEVIAGRTAYHADGSTLWDLGAGAGDGFCGIADLYDVGGGAPEPGMDGEPEVVRVWQDRVFIHNGATGAELANWQLPSAAGGGGGGGGLGGGGIIIIGGGGVSSAGAPTIADFDGDGLAEIGIAGATTYAVWDVDAAETLWSSPTEDDSSRVTASTVFDFNGDGTSEVIYNDEKYFRVFNGPDGEVLFEEPNPSRTRTEEPVVADVDADGNAEIVFVANTEVDFAGEGLAVEERVPGFEIWGSADDAWIPARRIWNQHTYHVDNVDEFGVIPAVEEASWLTHNTYRAQQPSGLLVVAPDLTAVMATFDESRCEDVLRVCASVQNTGEHFVGPGLLVTFYDGNPEVGAIALGSTETLTTLDPGDQEVVCVDWVNPPIVPTVVWVDVDSLDEERECDELNNVVPLGEGVCEVVG